MEERVGNGRIREKERKARGKREGKWEVIEKRKRKMKGKGVGKVRRQNCSEEKLFSFLM